ncbi:MAG: hypothetical protein ACW974_13475, partial [Candidatus Thorarchaeota archaeon]
MQLGFIQDLIALLPMDNILPLMLFAPLIAAFFAYILGSRGGRALTLIVTFIELLLSLVLIIATLPNPGVMWYEWTFTLSTVQFGSWSAILQIYLGVDGLSVAMVFLSNLVVFIAALSSNHINKSQHLYYMFFLMLQTGLLGVFMSLDL